MKVSFIIKPTKNNYTTIFCRIRTTDKDLTAKTYLQVKKTDWSENTQRLKQKAATKNKDLYNSKLNALETEIFDKWSLDELNKTTIKKDWLKNVVNVFFGKAKVDEQHKIYLTNWVHKFINDSVKRLHKGKPLSKDTLKSYNTTLRKLLEFEETDGAKIKFENINIEFYREFVNYCKTVQGFTNNTTGKHIKTLKMWCKNIELDGLPINQQYKHSEFTTLSNKTKDVYLNEVEINKIFNYDFKTSTRLDNVRDLFIIGLRTGLRISDFMSIKEINIKRGFVEIETQKTKQNVTIPLHNQIVEILNKRKGKLPYSISDQKFNEYIKEICNEVGIKEAIDGAKINPETKRKENGIYPKYELISSHTCRRSFASNLYGKLPNGVIMAITGHTTETMFLKYIKITKQEHAETLAKYWANEQNTKGITPILKAV